MIADDQVKFQQSDNWRKFNRVAIPFSAIETCLLSQTLCFELIWVLKSELKPLKSDKSRTKKSNLNSKRTQWFGGLFNILNIAERNLRLNGHRKSFYRGWSFILCWCFSALRKRLRTKSLLIRSSQTRSNAVVCERWLNLLWEIFDTLFTTV